MSDHRRAGSRTAACVVAATLVAMLILLVAPAPGLADEGHSPEPMEEPTPRPERHERDRLRATLLELAVPGGVELGDEIHLEATLTDRAGVPIADAPVSFVLQTRWGELSDEMVLGTALTDVEGTASVVTDVRTSGDLELAVRFDGDDRYRPSLATGSMAVTGDQQLYEPEVGLDVPGLGVWVLVVLVAAVWGLYALVARQVVGIAGAAAQGDEGSPGPRNRSRRRFLRTFVVPAALTAGVASLGSGLVAVLARSPRTHGNLGSPELHAAARHRLTPVARVGAAAMHAEVPSLLERDVSFADDVLPILRSKGGPHTHPSAASPPPHGVRLDSYAAIMGEETAHPEEEGGHAEEEGGHGHQLVVPGKPEESMLVMMLLDHAHRMPPSVPLSEEEIQLIATWVGQGAKDN